MGLGMNWMDRIALKQINELLNDPAHNRVSRAVWTAVEKG